MNDSRANDQPGVRLALQIVLIYALFAALWILFSDQALEALVSDRAQLVRIGMLKGWLFVAVTSALLYGLLRRMHGQLAAAIRREHAMQSEKLCALRLIETIAESSDDAIFAKDREGRYLLANRAASRFVGKPPGEIIGRDDRGLFPAEQTAALMAIDREVIERNRNITGEENLSTPDGPRTFLTTKGPLHDAEGRVIGLFGIARDITVAKQAEARLRDREEKLSAIVGYSPSALSLKTPDGRYALANPNLQRIHALSEAEMIGKSDFDLYPEATARSFRANDERVLQSRIRHSVEECLPVDGQPRTFMSHIFPVLGNAGEVRFICRISLDITERKQAEADLLQMTDDLAATLHAIPDQLLEVDEDGRFSKVEAHTDEVLAVPTGELLGRTVGDMLPPEAARVFMAAIAEAKRGGADYGRTITLPQADGTHHFELSIARKGPAAAAGQHFIVLSRDITHRKDAEEQLRRNNEELQRFNRATVGRELDMIELKRQVNVLSRELGREPPYPLGFLEQSAAPPLESADA